MRITIDIRKEGDALVNDFGQEFARIMRGVPGKVLAQLARDPATVCNAPEEEDKLRDINGNVVGSLRVDNA